MAKRKQPARGVSIKKNASGTESLIISFNYLGVRCREPFPALTVDNKSISAAEFKLSQVKNEILSKTFKYADHFPNGSKLKVFGGNKSNPSVKSYLDKVIKNAEMRGLKPSSLATYKSRAKELNNLIGERPIKLIDEGAIRDLAQSMNGKLKYESIRHILKVLSQALDESVIDKQHEFNPMIKFKLTKYIAQPTKKERKESIKPFTPIELNKLVLAAECKNTSQLIKAWSKLGMRTGEICALKWSHVDRKRKSINVSDNYVSMVGELGTTKTDSGERELDFSEDLELEKIINTQFELTGDHELVFVNPRTNGQWDSYSIRRMFVKTCKRADVEYRYAYQLRHTSVTMQISQGKNIWNIAKWHGHSSPDMIYRHYGDFIKEFEQKGSVFDENDTQMTLKNKDRV